MADKALVESLKRLEKEAKLATGEYADHLANVFVDHCHGSIFQDAAHSMSAIGMICLFVESLFVAIFRGLRDRTPPNGQTPIQDLRIRSSNNEYWDPHYVFEAGGRRISIVEGIVQLARA